MMRVMALVRPSVLHTPLILLVLVGACHGQGPDRKDVLQQGAHLVKPLPGLYRSTTILTAFGLPGAAPRTSDMMRDKFEQVMPQAREFCLTPAAAARGFQNVVRQSEEGDCAFERFVANAEHLSARMNCRSEDQLQSIISVEGTAAPDRSHVDIKIVQSGPSIPGGRETISLEVDNRRVGDCSTGNPGG
jgi:hypothetical protein